MDPRYHKLSSFWGDTPSERVSDKGSSEGTKFECSLEGSSETECSSCPEWTTPAVWVLCQGKKSPKNITPRPLGPKNIKKQKRQKTVFFDQKQATGLAITTSLLEVLYFWAIPGRREVLSRERSDNNKKGALLCCAVLCCAVLYRVQMWFGVLRPVLLNLGLSRVPCATQSYLPATPRTPVRNSCIQLATP